jgi:hypothetical protein
MTDPNTFRTMTSALEAMSIEERRILAATFTTDVLARQTLAGRADYTPADLSRVFAIFDNFRLLSPSIDASAPYRRNGEEHRKVGPEPLGDASGALAGSLSAALARVDKAEAEAA